MIRNPPDRGSVRVPARPNALVVLLVLVAPFACLGMLTAVALVAGVAIQTTSHWLYLDSKSAAIDTASRAVLRATEKSHERGIPQPESVLRVSTDPERWRVTGWTLVRDSPERQRALHYECIVECDPRTRRAHLISGSVGRVPLPRPK